MVEVAGPLACFTRPELKVERVSYPMMTPSAASGVLEAIYWKPEFRYVVRAIEVLRPIEWTSVRRNEVKSAISAAEVAALRKDPRRRYDVEGDRDQRNTMLLRDVAYRIRAQIRPVPQGKSASAPPAKYRDQLRRRVDKGACFSQPFLGCREFSCSFGPATDAPAIERDEELGVMLHSIIYPKQGERGGERYRWFRAQLLNGVLAVPERPLDDGQVSLPGAGAHASTRRR
ncbi:type I-C CRISPR-associated protein Cas5c [Streptomyces noursei]|uniref:type I-C CRISPR-associated protein Cas5c n=1 Tax=Streptomyces noursei TaxID=1971 RepID=UPI001F223FBD|nr:type I-C CRISPR-associated protein Cas5c [Streptomyces noursei]